MAPDYLFITSKIMLWREEEEAMPSLGGQLLFFSISGIAIISFRFQQSREEAEN
jgi:hypothetical protein